MLPSVEELPLIHISAAGHSQRIHATMRHLGLDKNFPKHLLPVGENQTLLGHVIDQAEQAGTPVVYANQDNLVYFQASSSISGRTILRLTPGPSPLSPVIEHIQSGGSSGYAQAGDTWSALNWTDFIDFHHSHALPVSVAVGHYPAETRGTRFEIDSRDAVVSSASVHSTNQTDLSPAGAYIIDPDSTLLAYLNKLSSHPSEGDLEKMLVAKRCMAAYRLGGFVFNINTYESYQGLLAHLAPTEALPA